MLLRVVGLRAHDDDHVGGHVDVAAGLRRGAERPDEVPGVEVEDPGPVVGRQAAVDERDAARQGLLQGRVLEGAELVVAQRHVALALGRGLRVRGGVDHQIDGRELALLPGRDEDQGRRRGRVAVEHVVERLAHGQQPRREVGRVEGVEEELHGDGPHVGVERERARGRAAEPVRDVFRVGDGRGQADHAHGLLQLGRHVARPRDHDLQRRALGRPQTVELVRDEERDALQGLSLLPAAAQHVPLGRRRQHDLRVRHQA
mmetsp:Transcript_31045/g.101924  ORF Transcript_31045/g.101924 Transcript_31045/m.101924 type:complete len:259 (+) Transcript_31045:1420-2196(+)